jgi:signal transduction histidine kinase
MDAERVVAPNTPFVLVAAASESRGRALAEAVRSSGHESMVLTDVESLLYHTRGGAPLALILEHALIGKVPQLDLVSLLRRRKPLAEMPMLILGPAQAEVHAAALESGADVYLSLPTHAPVLRAALSRLLARRQADLALRNTLTQLRQVEDAFKESERVKDDLTHMLVHDLKSPIASVMGLLDHCLEILDGGQLEPEPAKELLSLARTEAQHLLNLAANILDVRRMKEGHMPYHPRAVENLSALARQALQDVSGAPKDRHFSFLVRPEAETLHADPDLLRRILANLLSNAVKHTRQGGYVDFRAWLQDDAFVLSVRDDGEGIPEADQKRIFNAFEQSRHTIHDRYDTGMGLTFCKLAVEKHGGKIWVESKVGRGSTFFFTLPLAIAETARIQEMAVLD